MADFRETLYDAYGQQFSVEKVYFEHKTEHQHLLIFHNARFGRVMALDGIVQTTEADEFIYHEMLTHTPILAHGNAKRVLIIGGGDGGMLRETLRHQSIEHVTMVEIDQQVIEMCKEFLPNHSAGAYDGSDKRVNIVISDGMDFVRDTAEKFDVIISDSTDPMGPGEVLFTDSFYAQCKRCLNENGILVTQNGVPFHQLDEVTTTASRLKPVFADSYFYHAAVPTYVGGAMTFAWASDNPELRQQPVDVIAERFTAAKLKTRYYNPDIHVAAFALPQYILNALADI